jgi:prepilin-type processing-associated H-X9-DG protein
MGWGSYHPDGGNWLLCDGSVHYLSATVNVYVFCGLASVAGGEADQVPK